MITSLTTMATILLAYAGLAAFALAMDRHYRQMRGQKRGCPPQLRIALGIGGAAIQVLSLWAAARSWGWAEGSVAWFGAISGAATVLALLLAYHPRLALGATPFALTLGVVMLLGSG